MKSCLLFSLLTLSTYMHSQFEWAQVIKVDSIGNRITGLISNTGKIIIPPKYEYLTYYSKDSVFVYGLNGKAGFIDLNGNELTEPIFDKIRLDDETGMYMVKSNGEYQFINKLGAKIIGPLEFACRFINGKAYVVRDDFGEFINSKGETIETTLFSDHKCDYNDGIDQEFEMDESSEQVTIPSGFSIKGKEGKLGVKNKNGQLIVPKEFDSIEFVNDKYIYAKKNKLTAVYGINGDLIIPIKYNVIYHFRN